MAERARLLTCCAGLTCTGGSNPPLSASFVGRRGFASPVCVERYSLTVKMRSAESDLLDMLAKGLAKVSPEERKRVIKAGDVLAVTRRALLSKRRRRAGVRAATRDRIRTAS